MKAKFCLLMDGGLSVAIGEADITPGSVPAIVYGDGKVVLSLGAVEAEIPPRFVDALLGMKTPEVLVYRLDADGYAGEFVVKAAMSLPELYDAKVIMNYERRKQKKTETDQD